MARASSSIDAVASAVEHEPVELGGFTSPDGAVTLLFSDIEGSTEMIERLGEPRWFEVVRDHNAVIRSLVGSHDGNVVKSQGDGFMLAFSSAHAASRCAIEMQRTFGDRPRSAEPLKVRIGIHSGFVITDADDFYGRNVVLAARIADTAGGGEILVSTAVKEYTESDPSLEFEHRGNFRFKGLHGEFALYALLWQAAS